MSIRTKVILPESLHDAAIQLAAHGKSATVMGGGLDIINAVRDGGNAPEIIIPLRKIPGTSYIEGRGDIFIGASTTLAEIAGSRSVRRLALPLIEAINGIGTPQIRSQATIAGNLMQKPRCWYLNNGADCFRAGGTTCPAIQGDHRYNAIFNTGPSRSVFASDIALALWAMGGNVVIIGADGKEKSIPIREFYVDPAIDPVKHTILKPDEIIKEVHINSLQDNRWVGTFMKLTTRSSTDYGIVSVALVYNNWWAKFSKMQLFLGGVAPMPWEARETVNILGEQKKLNRKIIPVAAEAAVRGADPLPGNAYKLPLVQKLVERAIEKTYNQLSYVPAEED